MTPFSGGSLRLCHPGGADPSLRVECLPVPLECVAALL